jgi:hypothetical protein
LYLIDDLILGFPKIPGNSLLDAKNSLPSAKNSLRGPQKFPAPIHGIARFQWVAMFLAKNSLPAGNLAARRRPALPQ